jgi:hypothetical protein
VLYLGQLESSPPKVKGAFVIHNDCSSRDIVSVQRIRGIALNYARTRNRSRETPRSALMADGAKKPAKSALKATGKGKAGGRKNNEDERESTLQAVV